MVTKDHVYKVMEIYKQAWEAKDPDLIITLFTEDGTYHERILKEPHRNHTGIRQYWVDKVVGEQDDINFRLLNVYVDGDTAIAEWDAVFFIKPEGKTCHLREIAVLEFEGEKIKHFREYWHSERLD